MGCELGDPGSNLSSATSSEVCSKVANFFLLIEDYGYSKSRTKIGVSVDTKVWEKNSDPFTDIWSTHRYLIHSQFHASNMCERIRISMSYPIQLIELHVGKW